MVSLGIVIVNYNTKDFLEKCLSSIYSETKSTSFCMVVIDNASADQEFDHLSNYPNLQFILNDSNLGFSTACNQGLRCEEAEYYLLVNPDCVIQEQAIDKSVEYLKQNQDIGILGCRVNNPDGTLQLACRRKIPRPSTAFYRFSGLSFLFPRSKKLASYNLSYIDDGKGHDVEAVSGSFLLLRREVLKTVGYMDEDFFLYGEDLDLCYRAAKKGWRIYYYPEAKIAHHKRASSSRNVQQSNFHFYDAMRIFYRKHFYSKASRVERFLVDLGIRVLFQTRRVRLALFGDSEVGSRH